ncbi:uncharacterized protein Eint_020900 [Encephalitozoon intestinalis ATCC 50506]|uniref:t-SNARE coiled-coil homology domain-containing protein n=1 Tax=Encephalitozoon intestinalis (strain ATCC 50506) TaxID=876142 RepID=E0S5V3_ENCIT|nr:uncharacterized protein Eint_020900 [Encephalitozoon intestinalis ATCC 50506]ADM11088.1 hypothetical protein Eint_020900 [Encephalitozoon intestinalis ATCC 50506]UTX44742.1 DUF5089 domain-containing protein [Encephalitozoon intestinalis]
MGGDVYSLDKAVKSKKKKGVPQDVIEEAERIEEQNYERAKGVRMQLDESALKQKATTEELMRQGETLENAKRAAVGINVNARRGSEITEDIEREGRVFSCELPCVRAIKRWFRRDRGGIDDIVNRGQEEENDVEQAPKHVEFEEGEEYIKGQNKTDREMVGVLNTVRQIRVEADKQNKEAARHKSIVNDISMINERSSKVIRETDKELKKVE